MPLYLWASIGSLICQLEPRIFKIILPNKELFWKMSLSFNTMKTYDMPCITNLALIAVSVIGQPNLWTVTEVEHMGIIICGNKSIIIYYKFIINKSIRIKLLK